MEERPPATGMLKRKEAACKTHRRPTPREKHARRHLTPHAKRTGNLEEPCNRAESAPPQTALRGPVVDLRGRGLCFVENSGDRSSASHPNPQQADRYPIGTAGWKLGAALSRRLAWRPKRPPAPSANHAQRTRAIRREAGPRGCDGGSPKESGGLKGRSWPPLGMLFLIFVISGEQLSLSTSLAI